jgi:hypothetical protein
MLNKLEGAFTADDEMLLSACVLRVADALQVRFKGLTEVRRALIPYF